MRYLIIGISIIILFYECHEIEDLERTIKYVYKNTSGSSLSLEVYNHSDIQFRHYFIQSNDSIVTHISKAEVPTVFSFNNNVNEYGDSIIIRFNKNLKCLYYLREKVVPDDIFNIQKYDNYSSELLSKSSYTLYFTINEQDYNRSVICD